MRYEELEHPADLRLKIYGADEEELFSNAAFALFDRMFELTSVRERLTDEVEASGADLEETLVNFLSELLYRWEGERRVYRACRVVALGPTCVKAECRGEKYDASRHEPRVEIKAVTHHDVAIERGPDGLSVVVTCDV